MSTEKEVTVQLPYGCPPVLPDIVKQLQEYLLCPDRLPIHNYEKSQKFWSRDPDPDSLFHFETCAVGTTLKVDRDPTTGKLLQFREVPAEDIGCTAKNSLSLRRAPQPFNESVRGNVYNFPFWPGGFPELDISSNAGVESEEIDFENDLLHIAPGMSHGIQFKSDGHTPVSENTAVDIQESEVEKPEEDEVKPDFEPFNLMDIMKQEDDLLGLWKQNVAETPKEVNSPGEKMIIESIDVRGDELKVLPEKDSVPVLNISKAPPLSQQKASEWAEKIDETLPVYDFHQRIPKMAHTYKFDLDPFQQQAILKVEEHSNVFVAAHTSAGKTVVAEYAIALSKKHMTKTVYTSPIKALSNQKFRDFKKTFEDVGLITGDIQINKEANCLIMTTEILRSMLYQGSEVVRDLEFVIFDEVHYINNAERGHVWEEVLILLPKEVCIIMLSATVHNTLEFADWVGRTKKKKMYVISTLKRPVPLEHFLYTGTGGKQRNDRFLILDENGKFNEEGYNKAKQAKENKKPGKEGPKSSPPFRAKQEKTMWEALIGHLKEKEKLPVIAFTLSRNRCDENAQNLGVDLTSKEEKFFIRRFFNRCLDKLKECDKNLPQIMKMEDMLERGIGVHHSGILPLLKEIVEMLFQKEKVKLLFATETFAMGVNMPARTVVFDSIRKFNGQQVQNLLPAEYIQMAGRAGRRGLDPKGTVIILCKTDVPRIEDLKAMMLGRPEELTSQFRLTYSMILRLHRMEKISVEDMMSRSFMEFGKQCQFENFWKELTATEDKIHQMKENAVKGGNDEQLSRFFDLASDYLDLWSFTRCHVLALSRSLVQGRVLLITYEEHVNKLAVLLKTETMKRETKYQVLVLCNSNETLSASGDTEIKLSLKNEPKNIQNKKSPLWYKMLGLANRDIFVCDGKPDHTILTIHGNDIIEIYTKIIKMNTEYVLNDWSQRQLPRFRDKEPGQTCMQVVQELVQMSTQMSLKSSELTPIPREKITNIDLHKKYEKMEVLMDQLKDMNVANCPNFEEQFEYIFKIKGLERKRDNLRFKLSNESMALYPDYQSKVEVLRNLKYFNKNNAVDTKGLVAIKMRNHELIITELVLEGVLTKLSPPEIAALLSCLVFQQRSRNKDEEVEFKLGEPLEEAIKKVKRIERQIRDEERICGVEQLPGSNQELSFDLVEVVHSWAKGQPFCEIMELDVDVQEGIIVRCIQQLSETLNDVKDAATIIGDAVLKDKMDNAQKVIKRDIVFTPTLYTSETTMPSHEFENYENTDE